VSSAAGSVQVQLTNVDSNGTGNYFSLQGTEILLVSPTGAQLELLGGPGDGSDTMTGLTMLIANNTGFNPMPNGNPAGFPRAAPRTMSRVRTSKDMGLFPEPRPGTMWSTTRKRTEPPR
jgi:hypothetical protein